ncbi:two-component regulator propeller domain-containing protein [Candidatus Poribacteria bacterium]
MLDDATPHVAVPVEAVRDGEVISTTLSNKGGKYQFVNLGPGAYQLRCQVLGGYVYYGAEKARKPGSRKTEESENRGVSGEPISVQVKSGETLKDMDFRFAPFKKGVWKNYSRSNGLAGDRPWVIYRDSDSNMWFGDRIGGVTRYGKDGFATFTTKDGLLHDHINAIYQTPDGAIWFGTGNYEFEDGGVSRYDGKRFVNFTAKDGLLCDCVQTICQDKHGNLWFGTWDDGAFRYDGETFTNFTTEDGLASNFVSAIHQAPDGSIWFGTGVWWGDIYGGGVSRYDGETFTNFTTEDGLASNTVNDIISTPDGTLWFGTLNGVSRYDGKTFTNLTTADGLVNKQILTIYYDSDGVLWSGTQYSGISSYDGKTFVNFTTSDGLAGELVGTIHQDPDGVLWFGTESGVSRYDRSTFVNFTTADGLKGNCVWTIHQDSDGDMWLGSGWRGWGVFRYDGEEFVNFTTKDGLVDNLVLAIHQSPDGIMWFGTERGVSRYDGKEFVSLTAEDGLIDRRVMDIQQAPDGALWFAAWDGITRYDGEVFSASTTNDGLPENRVQSIHRGHNGMMWFGTYGGISRYNGEEFINFTIEDGLAADYVWTVHQDLDGVMWFGMATWDTIGGGLSRYDGKEFVNFSTEDGLAHNVVRDIHRDSDGILWIATNGGVSGYDGTTWTSLDTRDGLPSNTVRAIHQDPDGYLWFGTERGGLTRYRRSDTPPRVHIASVTADETYDDLSAIPLFSIGKRITVKYNAIDLKTHPDKQQYRCRVRNSDASRVTRDGSVGSEWDKPTKQTTFDWIPREAGAYTFQVQAIDRDLNYSEPASLEITISPPPFYTRAGFIIAAVLVAFLVPASAFATVVIRHRRQAFEPIQNPYIVGNPIRTKSMFFGRESDFEFVRAKLATGQSGLVIVFAGERRSGKTSILFQILGGALGEQFVPVLMDMQAMTVDSEAEFLEKMASRIDEALVEAGYSISPESPDFHTGNPTRIFEQFMAQVMEALGDKSLLLLLDEYELIETKMDDGVLRPDIITFFASQLEAHPRLSFIFTGSRHLEGRNAEYWSILIGKSLYRRISFLSESDALRLITEPVQDVVVYPRGIPERMVRLSAGQPFYTQVMCQNMMDRLNEVERNRVRQEDVDAVAQELADNPLPQMIYFWSELEQEQQGALSLLGEVLEDSNGYASAQVLLGFVQEQNLGLEFELSDLERVLNDLFVNEVLERERAGEGQYEYRFRADLFRLWVRQAHSVWE